MTETLIREYTPEDLPQLKSLWRRCFGDPHSVIDAFYALLPDMGTAMAAVRGDRVLGMANIIVGMELLGVREKPPVCGYIYALAVDRAERGHGLGAALARAAADKARAREAEIICVLPEDEALYGWYKERLGLDCALRRRRLELPCAALEPCMALSSTEYMLWRETMLRGRVHLHPSNPTLEFARQFFQGLGGGLYACGSGICAAYPEKGQARIHELITMDPGDTERIAASVGAELGCGTALCLLPSPQGEPYIAASAGAVPADCVWDLSFD